MACSIIRNSATNELESVLAPNGKESILFDSILKLQPDAEQALRMWAQAYTPSFKTVYGDWEKGESSLKLDANQEPLLSGINLPAFKNLKEGAYKPKDKLLLFMLSSNDSKRCRRNELHVHSRVTLWIELHIPISGFSDKGDHKILLEVHQGTFTVPRDYIISLE